MPAIGLSYCSAPIAGMARSYREKLRGPKIRYIPTIFL